MSLTDEDKQWIAALIEGLDAKLSAKIEHVETSLLTAFHKWASPAEQRLRSHASALRALDLQIEDLTDRVARLEGDRGEMPS